MTKTTRHFCCLLVIQVADLLCLNIDKKPFGATGYFKELARKLHI
jgi:hypothetical protein